MKLELMFVCAYWLAIFLIVPVGCPSTTVWAPPADAMSMWADDPGTGNALELCRKTRTSSDDVCIVMRAKTLSWWMVRWETCEEKLTDCEAK
jgi:hypothetical protein